MAILDWFSRYVLSWSLLATSDAWFCVQTLREALRIARPKILNTGQGSRFTRGSWIEKLAKAAEVTM